MRNVLREREELVECFEAIQENDGWNDTTKREGHGLSKLLEDDTFIYLAGVFNEIFRYFKKIEFYAPFYIQWHVLILISLILFVNTKLL